MAEPQDGVTQPKPQEQQHLDIEATGMHFSRK